MVAQTLDMVAGAGQYGFDPFGDYAKGRTQGNALAEMDRVNQARTLQGAALGGDTNAFKELAGVDPKGYMDIAKYQGKDPSTQQDHVLGVLNWADTPEKWAQGIGYIRSLNIPIDPQEEDFANRDAILHAAQTMKEQQAQANTDRTFAETQRYHDATIAKADKPTANIQDYNLAKSQGFTGSYMEFKQQTKDSTGGDDTADSIVAGIVSGDQPPTTVGLYKYGAKVRAGLAKQGYPLAQAQEDWQATQKLIATQNGPAQTRLRQATNFAYDSLPIIEELATKWDAGGYPPLTKVRLAAALTGALGPEANKLATQLNTQIADLTSELGTVYKGGNSSTDESLKLAAKNLNADWSKETLLSNVQLVRRNLAIRKNSLNLATAGTGDNPYGQKPAAAAAEPGAVVSPLASDPKYGTDVGGNPLGQTAVNPQTNEKVFWNGNDWVKF